MRMQVGSGKEYEVGYFIAGLNSIGSQSNRWRSVRELDYWVLSTTL